MGTNIQEVYDAFFVKVPNTDFTGQEQLVFQLFKAATAYCYRTVPEKLDYNYDEQIHEGKFNETLGQDSIELLSLCMKRELYRRSNDKYMYMKQHIGTKAFNKLPENIVKESQESRIIFESLNDEIERFRQEFYHLDLD